MKPNAYIYNALIKAQASSGDILAVMLPPQKAAIHLCPGHVTACALETPRRRSLSFCSLSSVVVMYSVLLMQTQ